MKEVSYIEPQPELRTEINHWQNFNELELYNINQCIDQLTEEQLKQITGGENQIEIYADDLYSKTLAAKFKEAKEIDSIHSLSQKSSSILDSLEKPTLNAV